MYAALKYILFSLFKNNAEYVSQTIPNANSTSTQAQAQAQQKPLQINNTLDERKIECMDAKKMIPGYFVCTCESTF